MKIQGNHIEEPIRAVDYRLLTALREETDSTIPQLELLLGVTSTAIRQRLDRLMEMGLVERRKRVAGRGRPVFAYCLTVEGMREVGADYGVLVDAMWQEILAIGDSSVREQLLRKIAVRLGNQFSPTLSEDAPVSMRLKELTERMAKRKITMELLGDETLPVIDIHVCPYPALATADSVPLQSHHEMCRLEEQMLSAALGERVQLSRCRMSGDSCCQFAVGDGTKLPLNEGTPVST